MIDAIKKIKLRPEDNEQKVFREVNALSRLNHQFIVRYFTCWLETSAPPPPLSSTSTQFPHSQQQPPRLHPSASSLSIASPTTPGMSSSISSFGHSSTKSGGGNNNLAFDDAIFQPNFDDILSVRGTTQSRSSSFPAIHFGAEESDESDSEEEDSDEDESTGSESSVSRKSGSNSSSSNGAEERGQDEEPTSEDEEVGESTEEEISRRTHRRPQVIAGIKSIKKTREPSVGGGGGSVLAVKKNTKEASRRGRLRSKLLEGFLSPSGTDTSEGSNPAWGSRTLYIQMVRSMQFGSKMDGNEEGGVQSLLV